jgi:hypothetical protein
MGNNEVLSKFCREDCPYADKVKHTCPILDFLDKTNQYMNCPAHIFSEYLKAELIRLQFDSVFKTKKEQ